MSLALVTLISVGILVLGYVFYGRFLVRAFGLDDARQTPACRINDGVDYVPAPAPVLMGQHFSAIAAVGPIAGPILAGAAYGWLPSLLWIAVGAVLIGGVHDFAALAASLRHDAKSVAEVVRLHIGRKAYLLFLSFIWLSLIYVIVVFTDLTAAAFVSRPELGAENFGPGVATSSFLYLGLAVAMGWGLYRRKWNLTYMTAFFVPLIFVVIWLGQKWPLELPALMGSQQKSWDIVIIAYCFIASVIPMWILLQPRGYLGGAILYATFAAGILGTLFGGMSIQYPAIIPSAEAGPARLPLIPLLFTTIACGACSGFHGLVSSGTTSKQIQKETDARAVGYGGMLMESFVAIVALSTVMMLPRQDALLSMGPDEIYARGLARFITLFGIPFAAAVTFAKLAFATFIYDTLDVSTRLGRYVFQELTGVKGKAGAALATLATLTAPLICILVNVHDASGKVLPLWKLFWPVFGATNQLLAALTLMAITLWLKHEGRKWWITGLPMAFMMATTLSSLAFIVKPWLGGLLNGGPLFHPVGSTAFLLCALALFLMVEALLKIGGSLLAVKTKISV